MRFILYENYIRKIGAKIKVLYIRESFITDYVISEVDCIFTVYAGKQIEKVTVQILNGLHVGTLGVWDRHSTNS